MRSRQDEFDTGNDLSMSSPIAHDSGQILACEEAGTTVTLPKPMTSN